MKRKLTCLGWILLISAHSVAAQSPVQIGVEGGASIATLTGTGVQTVSSRTSGYFGAQFVLQSEQSPLGFETGIAFVPKGASNNMSGARFEVQANYVEVPLLLRVNLPLQRLHVTPTFAVGASVGYSDGCRLVASSASFPAVDCDSRTQGGAAFKLKSVDLGMTARAGIDIPLGTRIVIAPAVAYTRGVSTISSSASAPDAVNSAFKLGVALRWRL